MIARHIKLDLRDAMEATLRRIAGAVWCKDCNEIVELLTVAEASTFAETNPATLLLWILRERIHCLDSQGRLLICATSLRRNEAVTGELARRST